MTKDEKKNLFVGYEKENIVYKMFIETSNHINF